MIKDNIFFGLRPELHWFSNQMENELKKNDYKGGWNDCTYKYLLSRLKQEINELEKSLTTGNNIVSECADVANFAMMIADNSRKIS